MTKRSALEAWLYGKLPDEPALAHRDRHKVTSYGEIVPQKRIIVLIFGAFIAYVLIIICGTLGSPNPVKINQVDCGLHNNCTISSKENYD